MADSIKNNMKRIKDDREKQKKKPKFTLKRVGGGFKEQLVEENDWLYSINLLHFNFWGFGVLGFWGFGFGV
jgi:hypothetical protein